MKKFMDKDFLLQSETAKTLYHDYAAKVPVLDYHCHINPREIAEDKHFDNITQVWLGGDHYKWRLMRSFGIEEKYITGDASDKEKFLAFAKCLGKSVGHPIFHWAHLELKKYFGYDGVLNEKTAEEVYDICNKVLQAPDMGARKLIKMSNVTLICTTDDPVDTLEWHDMIKADESFDVKVLPAWRPDKAKNIIKPEFASYINQLSEVSGVKIDSFKADISHSFFVTLDAVNILYMYISLSLAMPYFSPQIILDKYVPWPSISFSSVSSEKFFIFTILEHLAISLSIPESNIPIFIFCPLNFLFQNKYFVFK